MTVFEEHAVATASLIKEAGLFLTYKGKDYPIVPSIASKQNALQVGGFNISADFTFTALLKDFASDTVEDIGDLTSEITGKAVMYSGTEYKVDNVKAYPGGFMFSAECSATNRR